MEHATNPTRHSWLGWSTGAIELGLYCDMYHRSYKRCNQRISPPLLRTRTRSVAEQRDLSITKNTGQMRSQGSSVYTVNCH